MFLVLAANKDESLALVSQEIVPALWCSLEVDKIISFSFVSPGFASNDH